MRGIIYTLKLTASSPDRKSSNLWIVQLTRFSHVSKWVVYKSQLKRIFCWFEFGAKIRICQKADSEDSEGWVRLMTQNFDSEFVTQTLWLRIMTQNLSLFLNQQILDRTHSEWSVKVRILKNQYWKN